MLISASPVLAQAAAKKAARAAQKGGLNAARVPSDLKLIDNIPFKKVGDKSLVLMMFVPSEKPLAKSPLVIYIHGGGWGGGDRYRVLRSDVISVVPRSTTEASSAPV